MSLNYCNGLRFVEARQVEEVGFLMKLVCHNPRPVLRICGCEDGDSVSR